MINVNELKLGNYVYLNANRPNEIVKVQGVCRKEITTNEWTWSAEDFSPIPITPEILGRLGFVAISKKKFDLIICEAVDEREEDAFSYLFFDDFACSSALLMRGVFKLSMDNVHYVHHLQNIVNALAGKKLTLDSTGGEL